MSKMGQELDRKLSENKYEMLETLREISEGKGRYSLDQLTHASNTIEDMKKLASDMIAKIEGKDDREREPLEYPSCYDDSNLEGGYGGNLDVSTNS